MHSLPRLHDPLKASLRGSVVSLVSSELELWRAALFLQEMGIRWTGRCRLLDLSIEPSSLFHCLQALRLVEFQGKENFQNSHLGLCISRVQFDLEQKPLAWS